LPTQIAEDGRYLNVRNPLPAIHGLLAATASAGGLILVTCNLAGLARSDLRVLNPLDPPGHGK
jgi:predicted nucleic acid-binding protein